MQARQGKRCGWTVPYCGLSVAASLWMLWHPTCASAQAALHYDYSLGTDYRRARLDWNIAGSFAGTMPNILSELTWSDLNVAQVSAALQVTANDRFVLRGRAVYGAVLNGKNQDSDYNGDNRTQEFLRSNSKGGGEIGEGSIAVGYHWQRFATAVGRSVHVTPMLGYSRHLQYLTISDGRQTIPSTGPIANLDSNYNAEWSGPWLGLNLRLEADARNSVIINAEYHRADYYAEADWNLRDDLAHPVSFKHTAQGIGVIVSMAFRHAVAEHWDLVARMEAQKWQASAGIDTLYTINTTTGVLQPTATRLNEVNWRSLSAGVAATYHF
jgi:hypothetical protein